MNLQNKTVVITGGTDGLGLSLAKAFAAKGAHVVIIGRNKERLDKAVNTLKGKVKGFVADVSDYEQIQEVSKSLDHIDVLINNAGIWIEGKITDNTPEEITTAIDINLKGIIYSTKAFLPKLQESSDAAIINISSTSGLKGRDNQAVYAASKFGVTGFTESLKVDLSNSHIKVCGFYPGGMHTSLFEKAGKPKANQDWMDTQKVADIIVFMVERDATMMMDHVILNKRNTKTTN